MGENTITALVVEDTAVDFQLVSRFLTQIEQPAYLIQHAETAAAATGRLEQAPPDVILLDLNLPDSEGLQTFRTVQKVAENVPILIMTNLDDKEMAVQAVKEGAEDYLFKTDLRADLLARSVEYAIERHRIKARMAETVKQLRRALDEVKRLKGLLPMCSHCKRIRDDKGYWNQVEEYIELHADVTFTHGLCPDCFRDLYPEIYYKQRD